MTRISKRFACLGLVVAMAVPAGALAQDVAAPAEPVPQATPVDPTPATTAEPVAAPAPVEEVPAATEETEPAPAEETSAPVAGWFRLDSDFGGLQLWGGATFPVSDTIGIATDIYTYATYGEFDIGPSITLAPGISILPMVGLQIDWAGQKAVSFVPQFYAYVDTSAIYFEFWGQFFMNDVFTKGSTDLLHLRAFPLYKINDLFAVGIEVDANIHMANAAPNEDGDDRSIVWLPIGPHLKMNAGASSTIELFVGYDVGADDPGLADPEDPSTAVCPLGGSCSKDRKFAGRFTFVQTF